MIGIVEKVLIRMPDELKSSNKTCMGGGPPLVGTWAAIFANLRSAIGCAKFCKAGMHLHQAAATARACLLLFRSLHCPLFLPCTKSRGR